MKKILFSVVPVFLLITISRAQNLPSYVPANGLVGYWSFSGNANDESGNGNNGTVNGATLTTDKNGNSNSAFGFNGNSNYISIPATASTSNITTTASFSSWLYSLDGNNYFICKSNSDVGEYRLFCTSTYFRMVIDAKEFSINYAFPTNQWFHLVATYSMGIIKLFINGIQVGSTTTILNNYPPSNSATNLEFGRDPWGINEFQKGKIDEIGIWKRALTQQEITQIYTSTIPGNIGININLPQRNLHIKDVLRLEPRSLAPDSPGEGDIYYDATIKKLRVFDGTTWQNCW